MLGLEAGNTLGICLLLHPCLQLVHLGRDLASFLVSFSFDLGLLVTQLEVSCHHFIHCYHFSLLLVPVAGKKV